MADNLHKVMNTFLLLFLCGPNNGIQGDSIITATPPEMYEGFTDHLTINCSFIHDNNSDFKVMSLILSKTTPGSNNFVEIAAVSSYTPDNVTVKDSLGASVSGHLMTHGHSYILYQWQYPSNAVRGEYRCQAFGIDKIGHPKVSSADVEVAEKTVDLPDILEKMRIQNQQINGLTNQITAQNQQINGLTNQTIAQNQQINGLTDQVNGLKNQLQNSLHATFESFSSYQGHRYFLSRKMIHNFAVYESICESYGGYLVEINTQQEFDFVKNVLNNFFNNTRGDWVAIGATDESTEGTWRYMHSGGPLTFVNWAPGQPAGGNSQNYIELMADSSRLMHDVGGTADVFIRCMCELPSTT